jgi:peptidoglycan-N-acetylglucosamine deacetylase
MLKFRNTNIAFLLLLTILVVLDITYGISFLFYIGLVIIYSFFLFYGSAYVNSDFYFKVICSGKTNEKEIAISFDDGPMPEYTPLILETLRKYEVKATFFCIGKRANSNKELLIQVCEEGHIVGNHSYSHSSFFDLFGAKKMEADLQQMNEVARHTLGLQLKWFRPPYGVTNPNLKKAVLKGGFIAIGWNIRSLDTTINDKDQLIQKVLKVIKPGAIILFHDTCKSTSDMLPEFLEKVKALGYKIIPMDKLLNLQPYA